MNIRIPSAVVTAIAAAFAGAALAGAGTAAATTPLTVQDNVFIKSLNNYGIIATDPAGAIYNAHMICSKLSGGRTVTQVVNELGFAEADLNTSDLAHYVGSAVGTYCPAMVSAPIG